MHLKAIAYGNAKELKQFIEYIKQVSVATAYNCALCVVASVSKYQIHTSPSDVVL